MGGDRRAGSCGAGHARPYRRGPAHRAAAILAAGLAVAFGWRLSVPAVAADAATLKVVVTTAMVGDAVRAIGGDRVAVDVLLGEGVDPHLYKPTRADVARMLGADLIVASGLGLEAQFRDAFEQIGRTKPVVLAGDSLPRSVLITEPDFADRPDPHVWMDPQLWAQASLAVRDGLIARDPAGGGGYRTRQARYADDLASLAAYSRRVLATVPQPNRILVTAHDAFNYFARAYDFPVEGVQGVSTESEAGLKRIEDVVQLVSTRGIPAIFVEASVPERNVRAVVEGAARRGHAIVVGPPLFSDSMGPPGTYEGTYRGMIDHNVTSIARALGGAPPERGEVGCLGSRD